MVSLYYAESKEDLRLLFDALQASPDVGFDLETTGLQSRTDSILLYQFATKTQAWVVNGRLARQYPRAFGSVLEALAQRTAIGHNLRFEYAFIKEKHGVLLTNIFDTQLAEALLTAGRADQQTNLGATMKRRLRLDVDKELQTSFIGLDPDTFEPTPEQVQYALADVVYMHRLRDVQRDRLITEGLSETFDLELRALPVFAEMEEAGLTLDLDCHASILDAVATEAAALAEQLTTVLGPVWTRQATEDWTALNRLFLERQEAVEKRIYFKEKNPTGDVKRGTKEATALYAWRDEVKPKTKDVPEFSLTSREKVLFSLRTKLGWPAEYLPDLKKQTLLPIQREPLIATYSAWVKANKVLTSFGQNLRDKVDATTGRVHPHYNQIVSTGRTSSSNPNGQQMPPAIRKCFVPAPGHRFVVADFSNMELRIAAGLAGDEAMMSAFRNGWDVHRMTAAAAWPDRYQSWQDVSKEGPERAAAKTVNFATIYGGTPYALYWRGLVDSEELAETVQAGFKAQFAATWEWVQANGALGLQQLSIRTAGGRKRYFRNPGPMPAGDAVVTNEDGEEEPARVAWNRARKRIRRQAMNHPVQGTGADIAKEAMYRIWTRLGDAGRVVGMVHDEIIVEVREECADEVATLVAVSMEQAGAVYVPNLPIPGEVHIAERWEK